MEMKSLLQVSPSEPRLQDLRQLVPDLGYRNYWYPALLSSTLKKQPIYAKRLGEEIVFWRNSKTGQPYAIEAWCPHRGSALWLGKQHFPGTLSCPFHGWTFDGDGVCRAALAEGPDSSIPGKVKIRAYPVRELAGLIWVWIGEMDPVPLEEDIPAELLDPQIKIHLGRLTTWACNWRVTFDNAGDSHEIYLHRSSLSAVFNRLSGWALNETLVSEDRVGTKRAQSGTRAEYVGLGTYPKRDWWRLRIRRKRSPSSAPLNEVVLPCLLRVGNVSYHLYMRYGVPVDENTTLNFHFVAKRVNTQWERFRFAAYGYGWSAWHCVGALLDLTKQSQDQKILETLNYKRPERLSMTDDAVIQWRKLSSKARGYHP